MNWISPKRLVLDQNDLDGPKLFWTHKRTRHLLVEKQTNKFLIGQKQCTNALSFYGSKMILDRPNHFGRVPIILEGFNSFWLGSNHFGQVQIIKIIQKSLI